MKRCHLSLRQRILSGYIVLFAVITCMSFILVYERKRYLETSEEISTIWELRRDITTIHQRLITLYYCPLNIFARLKK